jgi:hypothetical protein
MPWSGHVHDWENAVVFVKNNTIRRVAVSANGRYHSTSKPLLQDGHPLIVYHKLFLRTHSLRLAKDKDLKKVKNHYGEWVIADLVGWDGYPSKEFKESLLNHKFGKANFHLRDGQFEWSLEKAAKDGVPGFDCLKDGGDEYKDKGKDEKKGNDENKERDKDK